MTTAAKIQEFALPKERNAKRIVMAGLGILLLAVSMYVYFVGKIVFDVVGRRVAESSICTSQSTISSLGVEYFASLKSLDIHTAESMGLALSHATLYAVRTAPSVAIAR